MSEKAGSGSRGDRLSGPGKGRLGAGGTVWEKKPCPEGSTGGNRVYPGNRREPKKLIPDGMPWFMKTIPPGNPRLEGENKCQIQMNFFPLEQLEK